MFSVYLFVTFSFNTSKLATVSAFQTNQNLRCLFSFIFIHTWRKGPFCILTTGNIDFKCRPLHPWLVILEIHIQYTRSPRIWRTLGQTGKVQYKKLHQSGTTDLKQITHQIMDFEHFSTVLKSPWIGDWTIWNHTIRRLPVVLTLTLQHTPQYMFLHLTTSGCVKL